MSNLLFTCTIPGRCYVKKNGAKRVGRGKSTRVIYTKNYLAWANTAILELRQAWLGKDPLNEPIEVRLNFYFKDKQSEVDCSNAVEGPCDVLKTASVISDDKIIKRLISEKYFYENPRTEIEIRKYEKRRIC